MEKNTRPLWKTPGARLCGGDANAPHQQEQPPWLVAYPTYQEEQHRRMLHQQVKELSWLAQQVQQELAEWTTTDLSFLHQCVMEQLATAMVKRAVLLQQITRRDLERKASCAQDASNAAERGAAPKDVRQDDVLASYDQAEHARRAGRYALALHSYDQAITQAPSLTLAYHGRAACYLASEQYRRALADYGWILACDPRDVLAYYQRGEVYRLCRQYKQALADYDQAIALEPDHVPALLARAEVSLLLKQKARASSDFAQAARCEPDNSSAAWMAVFTSLDRDRPGNAVVAHLETLATCFAPTEEGALCRGVALGLRGRWQAGLIVLEQMLAQEPSSAADGCFWQGMLLALLGEQAAARAALEQALRRGLPSVLLTPLHWLEEEQPTFYQEVAKPLLQQEGAE